MGIGASLGNAIGQLPQNQTQQAGRPLGPTQPQMGMGGKGMGQQQPLGFSSLQNQPQQAGGTLGMNIAGINPQTGMSPKGSAPPLPRGTLGMALAGYDPQNGGFPQQNQPDLAARRAAFDAANPQPVYNPMNDPYAARFGVPGNYVGTPAPDMAFLDFQRQMRGQLTPQQQQNAVQYGDAYYGQPQRMATTAELAATGLRQPQLPPQFMNRDQMRQMAMEQERQSNQPQEPISFNRNRNRNRNRGPF
jgi:hypothetical protein